MMERWSLFRYCSDLKQALYAGGRLLPLHNHFAHFKDREEHGDHDGSDNSPD